MNPRKSHKADLENKKGLFLQIGIFITLAVVWTAFEWKTYEAELMNLGQLGDIELEDDMIATARKEPPKPSPPPQVIEQIQVVEDDIEIEELEMESTDFSEDDEIELIEEVDDDLEVYDFLSVETMPIFPGCEGIPNDEMNRCFGTKAQIFLARNFEYPNMAREMGIQGKVLIQFVVAKNGTIEDIQIIRSVDKYIDDEAVRTVKKFPKMEPAKVGGRPVRMKYILPINAVLQ